MDVYASFGFIDLIVIACGLYGVYSWYLLVYKHEIKKTLLIGGNTNPQDCKDIEGFAAFMGTKLLILSAVMIIFGGISAYSSYVEFLGTIVWVGMAIFLVIIIWYCVQLRKAEQKFFDQGSTKGSIKSKALRK